MYNLTFQLVLQLQTRRAYGCPRDLFGDDGLGIGCLPPANRVLGKSAAEQGKSCCSSYAADCTYGKDVRG
jgi:hypothetical protein